MLRHERSLRSKGFSLIAGIDEAGRGPLAGPVVAACVILKTFDFKERIDDSKALTAAQRERAFGEIIKKAHVGIGIVDEKAIDTLNILNATSAAMEKALSAIDPRPDFILIDGSVKVRSAVPTRGIIRGDSLSLSVAAASIIAKVTRDRIMVQLDEQYPVYGFSRHKGYGTKFHLSALRKHGPSPIHRLSFKGTTPLNP